MRKQKLWHLRVHLVMTSKCIMQMRGEEGKRETFTWEVFKNAGENTNCAKYNSPEAQKCLCIAHTSIAMQTLYTTWHSGGFFIVFPSSSMPTVEEKLFISLQRICCSNYPEIGLWEEKDNLDWRDLSSSSKSAAKNSSGTISLGWVSHPYQTSEFPSWLSCLPLVSQTSLQQFLLLAAALLLQGLVLAVTCLFSSSLKQTSLMRYLDCDNKKCKLLFRLFLTK